MDDEGITSEHTYARMKQVLDEVEALRLEMGRNKDSRQPMLVSDATSREVFYHAQTVHRKANQLCVELNAEPVNPPGGTTPTQLGSSDVLRVLDSTRARLAEARAQLKLEGDVRPELPGPLPRVAGKVASDTLAACLVASRQLNMMLTHAFTSREGHDRLVTALGLTQSLLAFHGAELPPAPPLERRKFPRDVYQVMWRVYEVLHHLLRDSGIKALELREQFAGEEPGDVYDLGSLIFSELDYVWALLPNAKLPTFEAPTPSLTLPAHNYRRAVQLLTAVGALATAVRARPDWLGSPG